MSEVTPLPPELSGSVSALARSLVAAARSWSLYPPEHPAVRSSVERLAGILRRANAGQVFGFGVTPDTLLIDGVASAPGEPIVAEAAAWLHQRDILRLTFLGDVPSAGLHALLALLAEDVHVVRRRGGPAKAWQEAGFPGIELEQIDLSRVLEEREVEHPARRRDELWRAIVSAVTDRRKTLDEAVQRRLLEIAGDIGAIANLAGDVSAPNRAADGSPMLTSQAAAVFAAYRHLVGIVDVMSPDRRTEVMQNLAEATASLDPRLIVEMLGARDESGVSTGTPGADIKRSLAEAFDDFKVAQLLATTLAIDGQATGRLANVFDTIAPDEPRKRRVLTLTRSLLSETSFGRTNQFQTLWTSMEELLLTYNEKPFVSAEYQLDLDQVGSRAESMAADLPEDLAEMTKTLGQDNVRRLSVILLIDLLKLEGDPVRAPELARDVAALCEDLLLAGDYEAAVMVTAALAEQAADKSSVTSEGSRLALDTLSQTPAFLEAVELLGGMTDDEAARFSEVCAQIGPAATDALRSLLVAEELTPARRRASAVIRNYGGRAATRLTPLVSHQSWAAQRNAAELLGELQSPDAVPVLQPLLRGSDPRVTQAAVRALAGIDDPAAARAVHTVLRAAAGAQRKAVVDALVAERDPRVVPLLVRILNESEPFGSDHPIVIEALGAIGQIGGDQAVPHVTVVMKRRKWLARRKLRALRQASLDALRAVGSPAAEAAIVDAAATGDRLLRKMARTHQAARRNG
jgi:HEAT repeat protein